MNPPLVVSNSSPLIALAQIGHLNLLEKLFTTVVIPPSVTQETTSVVLPAWVIERPLAQPIGPRILRASLGPGESEAISLALEVNAQWIIVDDRPARRLAETLNLPVLGTLGVLLASKRRGFLSALRPCIDVLVNLGFRIAPDLYERVVADAGEG
ncbi:MAG: DUF3368 domain-containing protein [Deltaproteobacteria bacterium]|nr:DUF3368 domain-containing protein [Deltaproteobacteria bacterium]